MAGSAGSLPGAVPCSRRPAAAPPVPGVGAAVPRPGPCCVARRPVAAGAPGLVRRRRRRLPVRPGGPGRCHGCSDRRPGRLGRRPGPRRRSRGPGRATGLSSGSPRSASPPRPPGPVATGAGLAGPDAARGLRTGRPWPVAAGSASTAAGRTASRAVRHRRPAGAAAGAASNPGRPSAAGAAGRSRDLPPACRRGPAGRGCRGRGRSAAGAGSRRRSPRRSGAARFRRAWAGGCRPGRP
ncbi:Uncharacterised protein [Klebsiella pneumoniae]|nr:Uncharacterised protein [Klebsiella pneumoniae]